MSLQKIRQSIGTSKTHLCIGIDPIVEGLPEQLPASLGGIEIFYTALIDISREKAASYKINFAFFEKFGSKGYKLMERIFSLLPVTTYRIADAKRGDIGNTAQAYAHAVFREMEFDAVTVSPYMGLDTLRPFTEAGGYVFSLALTSNEGSSDFQRLPLIGGRLLYEEVMRRTADEFPAEELGYVVGATHPSELAAIRATYPDRGLLIPGVGAQGGDPAEVLSANEGGAALINVSRGISKVGAAQGDWEAALAAAVELWSSKLALSMS